MKEITTSQTDQLVDESESDDMPISILVKSQVKTKSSKPCTSNIYEDAYFVLSNSQPQIELTVSQSFMENQNEDTITKPPAYLTTEPIRSINDTSVLATTVSSFFTTAQQTSSQSLSNKGDFPFFQGLEAEKSKENQDEEEGSKCDDFEMESYEFEENDKNLSDLSIMTIKQY